MNEQEDEGTGVVGTTKCNHLLYPVRNGQTTVFEYFECQLCGGQWEHHELQAEFARLREEAQKAVEAERARIVAALEAELEASDEAYSDIDPIRLDSWKSALRWAINSARGEEPTP